MTLASRRLSSVVAVLYSTWLVAPLLDPQLHPWTSYASEYFVADRPAATLLRTAADRVTRIASWAGIVTITLSGTDALVIRIPTEGITQRISMVAIVVWLVAAAGLPVVDRVRAARRTVPA